MNEVVLGFLTMFLGFAEDDIRKRTVYLGGGCAEAAQMFEAETAVVADAFKDDPRPYIFDYNCTEVTVKLPTPEKIVP